MCAHQLQDFVLLPHTGWRLVQAYSTTWRKKKKKKKKKKGIFNSPQFHNKTFSKNNPEPYFGNKGCQMEQKQFHVGGKQVQEKIQIMILASILCISATTRSI